MSAAPTLDDLFYRDPAVGLSSQFCSSKEELAKRFGKAAPRMLEARECVSVRNIERGDVVGNLHHSRRRVGRAGHKHGNLAIIECVGKEPKLPSILHAH
jgi:hypothetical protein